MSLLLLEHWISLLHSLPLPQLLLCQVHLKQVHQHQHRHQHQHQLLQKLLVHYFLQLLPLLLLLPPLLLVLPLLLPLLLMLSVETMAAAMAVVALLSKAKVTLVPQWQQWQQRWRWAKMGEAQLGEQLRQRQQPQHLLYLDCHDEVL